MYAYGPATGSTILRVGALDDFVCNAYPGNQGCADLSIGTSVPGNLASMANQGDHTMYLFAGMSYAFFASSTQFDTYLSLYSPQNTFLTASNDLSATSTNSVILYTAPATGLYRLAVNVAAGSGAYTLAAFVQPRATADPAFIDWPGSVNGAHVIDHAVGDGFAFDAGTRCLYSENRQQLFTDFCLDPARTTGTFGGQRVTILMVYSSPGHCVAAMADPTGFAIDIDTTGMIPVARKTNSIWDTYGCY